MYRVCVCCVFANIGQLPVSIDLIVSCDVYFPTEELEAVRGQVGFTGKPPAAPPPAESPPPDLDEPEDVYDIPSEAIDQAGGVGRPPAPPPASPPPIDEDIYDMGMDEDDNDSYPAPVPVQPPRPPKSSPFNDRKGPPPIFQPPQLVKPPIGGPKAPAVPPPNSPPTVTVS